MDGVGERVRLRDWLEDDLESYLAHQAPGAAWQELDGPYYARQSEEELERTIERIRDRIRRQDWPDVRTHLVIADADDDRLIGRVSRYWQSEETWWLSVGIAIYDERDWGRGLGHQALGLWSDYLFAHLPNIVRLDLRTWSGNVGMIRLAEKLGYQREACFRMARIVAGQYYDGLGYGILRSEWEARHPQGFKA